MQQLWKCRFCDTTTDHLTENGKCPNCGGPGPTEIKEETPRLNFYQSAKSVVFRKTGYNGLNTIANLFVPLLVVLMVLAYAKPEMRSSLQGLNLTIGATLIGLGLVLNRFGLTTMAVVAFVVAFMLY